VISWERKKEKKKKKRKKKKEVGHFFNPKDKMPTPLLWRKKFHFRMCRPDILQNLLPVPLGWSSLLLTRM